MSAVERFVPKLRFAGFDNQWNNYRLRDVLILKSRPLKMKDNSKYSLVTVKRKYGGIVSRGIFKGKDILVKSQFAIKENDFLISKRQISHNACGIVPKNIDGSIVSNEYSVFKPKPNFDIVYFDYFCHLPKVSHSFFLSSIGVHIEKMLFKVNDWLKWEFCFPTLPEQQKISSFFSVVDKKIEMLSSKKRFLEVYKTGVMQKIFSQEIRFKDENGKGFPDWEEKRLGEVCKITTGKLDANAMVNEGMYRFYTCAKDYYKINNFAFDTEALLISGNGANVGYIHYYKGRFNAYQRTYVLDLFLENIQYIKRYLEKFLSIRINREKNEGNTPYITLSTLSDMVIRFPNKAEQQKIANFLTSIEKKIETVQTQLFLTQTFKKGLLQKMFV